MFWNSGKVPGGGGECPTSLADFVFGPKSEEEVGSTKNRKDLNSRLFFLQVQTACQIIRQGDGTTGCLAVQQLPMGVKRTGACIGVPKFSRALCGVLVASISPSANSTSARDHLQLISVYAYQHGLQSSTVRPRALFESIGNVTPGSLSRTKLFSPSLSWLSFAIGLCQCHI